MVRSAGACLDNLLSSYRNGSTIFCFVFFPSLERVSVCWSEPKNENMQNMPFLLPFNIHTLVFLGFTAGA